MIFEETYKYKAMICQELYAVARTALRAGKPDQLHSTSVVMFYFKYSGTEETLAERFIFSEAKVISLEDLATINAPAWRCLRISSDENIKSHPEIIPPSELHPFIHLNVIMLVKYRPDPRHLPSEWRTFCLNIPVDQDIWMWAHFVIPLEDRKLLQDWVGYLRKVLIDTGSLPRDKNDVILSEMLESEGTKAAAKTKYFLDAMTARWGKNY
ncbi:hypothetical protein P7C70_g902, partial [Phenoliferia sp. Uapishka_3]